ncbi:hypothetical protein [Marinivivus vitaminiproducens]|uniref:hypothetical protein n=1 Tax=Marinivivus vitaminiproducens TaxID=3035935 RepID=UPI0027A17931|nr:hypothetical protein P4R82_02070 [Geminicoccaceae bacterium SCSIO 64248]
MAQMGAAGDDDGERAVLHRLWRGGFPLGTTFWLYGLLGVVLVNLGQNGLEAAGAPPAVPFAVFLANGFWRLFMLVAVWRSAHLYRGPMHWRTLARLAWIVIVLDWAVRLLDRAG